MSARWLSGFVRLALAATIWGWWAFGRETFEAGGAGWQAAFVCLALFEVLGWPLLVRGAPTDARGGVRLFHEAVETYGRVLALMLPAAPGIGVVGGWAAGAAVAAAIAGSSLGMFAALRGRPLTAGWGDAADRLLAGLALAGAYAAMAWPQFWAPEAATVARHACALCAALLVLGVLDRARRLRQNIS